MLSPRGSLDAETNSLPIQQIEQMNSELLRGANEILIVSDATGTLVFNLLAGDTNIIMRLTEPNGLIVDFATTNEDNNIQYSQHVDGSNTLTLTYAISDPPAGVWKVMLDARAMNVTTTPYSLWVFGDSDVGLIPQTGALCNQGQDILVSTALMGLESSPATPLLNATITALVQLPDGSRTNLGLFDDGLHNDGPSNDGSYAALLAHVQMAGDYLIEYRARATNASGQPLQRVQTGRFSVSSGSGSIWGDPAYAAIDTDGDGIGDILQVNCWLNLTNTSGYILSGDLVNASGDARFSKSAQFISDGSGPMNVALLFNLTEIEAAAGPGDLHIENLRLFEVQSTGTAWLDTYSGVSVVPVGPARIAIALVGNELQMSWAVDCLGWELQVHTNSLDAAVRANWSSVPGSKNSTRLAIPFDPAGVSHFYRLKR